MNQISIKYEWLRTEPVILINEEPLDILNETLSALRRDFIFYAPSLFSILDKYFGSPYMLDFCGTAYQCECLRRLSAYAVNCEKFTCSELVIPFKLNEIYGYLSSLGEKYGCGQPAKLPLDVVCLCGNTALESNPLMTVRREASGVTGNVLVFDPNAAPETLSEELLVCPADNFGLFRSGDQYIYAVPADLVGAFLEYYAVSTVVMPFAAGMINRLSNMETDKRDAVAINGIRRLIPQFYFEFPQTLEVGAAQPYTLFTFPAGNPAPFSLQISEPDAFVFDGGAVKATQPGSFEVRVVSADGSVAQTQRVQVTTHSYVRAIKLVPNFTMLYEHEEGQLNAYVVPETAEDAADLVWTSSNINIAHVSKDGHVVAFGAGKCTVTVSAKNTSASYEFEVKVKPEDFVLSSTNASIRSTQSVELYCAPQPANADLGKITWALSNPAAGSLQFSQDGRACRFLPNRDRSVSCTIKCTVEGMGTKQCTVNSAGPRNHTALFVIALLLSIFAIIVTGVTVIVCAALEANMRDYVALPIFGMMTPLILNFIGVFTHRRGRFIAWLIIDIVFVIAMLAIMLG